MARKNLCTARKFVNVYDLGGNLSAEIGGAAPPCAPTFYVSVDQVGSTRLVTDASGTVVRRYDYTPFGEEIPGGTNWRATTPGYQAGAGVDAVPGTDTFEIHVLKGDVEKGLIMGRNGWIGKHGKPAMRPSGIPESVVRTLNAINVDNLKRRGQLPAAWRSYKYLNAGRVFTFLGAVSFISDIWEAAHTSDADYNIKMRAFCLAQPTGPMLVSGYVLDRTRRCRDVFGSIVY